MQYCSASSSLNFLNISGSHKQPILRMFFRGLLSLQHFIRKTWFAKTKNSEIITMFTKTQFLLCLFFLCRQSNYEIYNNTFRK